MLISDNRALRRFCQSARNSDRIAVDTEFVWRKTYIPKLALIQLHIDGQEAVAIDTLAEGIDLRAIGELLANESILKIFHSAENDVDLLRINTGAVAKPIYDTQKAAAFCRMSTHCGYAALAKEALNVEIDKSEQKTDWSVRPLSKAQIEYALNDVIYLPSIYRWLSEKLTESGLSDWVKEETTSAYTFRYMPDPWKQWTHVAISRPIPENIGILRELCAWREQSIKRLNIPRYWFAKDKTLAAISKSAPKSLDQLSKIPEVPAKFASRYGHRILSAVEKGSRNPIKTPLSRMRKACDADKALIAELKNLLYATCDKAGISPPLVATTTELNRLVLTDKPDVRCISGWRNDFFGKTALAVKNQHRPAHTKDAGCEIASNGNTFPIIQ